jgi:hypothetical protein
MSTSWRPRLLTTLVAVRACLAVPAVGDTPGAQATRHDGGRLPAIQTEASPPGLWTMPSETGSAGRTARDGVYPESGSSTGGTAFGAEAALGNMWIVTAIKLRLFADSRTSARDVGIDARSGVVTLRGTVPSLEAKLAAQEDAQRVSGVLSIRNELEVVAVARRERSGEAPNDHSPAPASAALGVSIGETPDAVRLRVQPSEDVEVGSVEVRFEDHAAVVVACDAEGRPIRSRSLRLPEPVIEEGASAEYDADGTLVVMLRKRSAARDAESPSGH